MKNRQPAAVPQTEKPGFRVNVAGLLRIVLVGVLVAAQLALLTLSIVFLRTHVLWLYVGLQVIGLVEVLTMVERHRTPAFSIAWLCIMMILPVFGHILFLLWGRSTTNGKKSRHMLAAINDGMRYLQQDPATATRFEKECPTHHKLSAYLSKEGFPVFDGTASKYYALGEDQFDDLLVDLQQAERFIFLEFFIVASGLLWERVHPILRQKAAEGVEVRLLYDDFGSIVTLPKGLPAILAAEGILVRGFNPVHKHISRLMVNYRNHQKIVVVDGHIGYTGGTNLADEYANLYEKHGHWKDVAIRLEGEAVWGLTVTFLQMWACEEEATGAAFQPEDYQAYQAQPARHAKTLPAPGMPGDGDGAEAAARGTVVQDTSEGRPVLSGFYQPFCDGPVNHPSNPAEAVYRQSAFYATQYLYIATPYLIIEDNMADAFCLAAASGVDVRIITPGKWDKWTVFMVTRSNYGRLLAGGVRIFEYTPGFIHAKTVISDDSFAMTGSINLDYRSLYLHFENGVCIYDAPVLQDIKADAEATLAQCHEVTLEEWKGYPWYSKLIQSVLRIIAPLL